MEDIIRYFYFLLHLLEIENKNIELIIKKGKCFYNSKMDIVDFECYLNCKAKALACFENDKYSELTVYLDLNQFSNLEEYNTLTHEVRHIYQLLAINEFEYEEEWIVDEWKRELVNYKTADNPKHKEQIVELDANAFNYVVMVNLFDVVPKIELINEDFEDLCFKIYEDFNTNDYSEALTYSKFDYIKIKNKIKKQIKD